MLEDTQNIHMACVFALYSSVKNKLLITKPGYMVSIGMIGLVAWVRFQVSEFLFFFVGGS